ncbi:MAG: hypothetical protein WBE88_14740, partial [Candidatus Acidiferrales bacterium]
MKKQATTVAPDLKRARPATLTVAKKSTPIPRQSLAAAVVERLREKIISGELREGEQLRQDVVAAEYQIS